MPATRSQRAEAALAAIAEEAAKSEDDVSSDEEEESQGFVFAGKVYAKYEDMVDAKRERNRQMLEKSGLLEASAALRDDLEAEKSTKRATQRGIRSGKRKASKPLPRRKSSRIAGEESAGIYIENESGGRFTFAGAASSVRSASLPEDDVESERFFNDRINDGSDLTVKEAVEGLDAKWVKEGTVTAAKKFMGEVLPSLVDAVSEVTVKRSPTAKSPTSIASVSMASLSEQVGSLSVEDENCVSKVVPDRIYSIACHPSSSSLIVCAGDKQGHVGLWNVDSRGEDEHNDTDGVHLFKPHSRVVTHLEWNRCGNSLISASYDGSVRLFDLESQKFQEIFATYDDSSEFKTKLGYGVDNGYRYWTQYFCLDHRSADGKCLFLSTSEGTAMHVDLRSKGQLTFHQKLSEKKINSLSLHSDGNILASAGLDGAVKLWDIRKFKSSKHASKFATGCKPIATQQSGGKSINSAFFSASGKSIVSTTQNNYLDLTDDMHKQSGNVKATKKVRHDNHTGRWLSTFMAQWHPTLSNEDLFVVGCMRRPRTMELYNGQGSLLRGIHGEQLTAVCSRCCFHPSEGRLILVGGNSSGRVTVAR